MYVRTLKCCLMTVYEQIFSDFKKGEIASFYEKMYPDLLIYTSRLLCANFAFLAEVCVPNAVFNAFNTQNSHTLPTQWNWFL